MGQYSTGAHTWFMRNAGTGVATARMQARLYLMLLGGEIPSAEDAARAAPKKASPAAASVKQTARKPKSDRAATPSDKQTEDRSAQENPPPPANNLGPNLHIDMQIHISADASDTQIDTIFKSMAKHLYGRE